MSIRAKVALLLLTVLGAVVGCVLNYAARGSRLTVEGDRMDVEGSNTVKTVDTKLSPR